MPKAEGVEHPNPLQSPPIAPRHTRAPPRSLSPRRRGSLAVTSTNPQHHLPQISPLRGRCPEGAEGVKTPQSSPLPHVSLPQSLRDSSPVESLSPRREAFAKLPFPSFPRTRESIRRLERDADSRLRRPSPKPRSPLPPCGGRCRVAPAPAQAGDRGGIPAPLRLRHHPPSHCRPRHIQPPATVSNRLP